MGNGNEALASRHRSYFILPTPHGERERYGRLCPCLLLTASNPSWGTGTRRSNPASSPPRSLPTPHGEREPGVLRSSPDRPATFQPLMGNGNSASSRCTWSIAPSSNPSWGTGTSHSGPSGSTNYLFQPLMGNGNTASRRATRLRRSGFQPLMGNGNESGHHVRELGEEPLPTPHGEREQRHAGAGGRLSVTFQPLMGNGNSSVGAHFWWADTTSNPSWGTGTGPATASAALADPSNPSWGTGTAARMASTNMCARFQPLMGNGNGGTPMRHIYYNLLPTPHGEREHCSGIDWNMGRTTFQPLMGNGNRPFGKARSLRHKSSNPSWGTGTAPYGATPGYGAAVFQPLMGNGNSPRAVEPRPRSALPTPHGEREPIRRDTRAGRRRRSSNPSWGTGTPVSDARHRRHDRLPTPHGEREPYRCC